MTKQQTLEEIQYVIDSLREMMQDPGVERWWVQQAQQDIIRLQKEADRLCESLTSQTA